MALSDEQRTNVLYKMWTGSSGAHPPPLSVPLGAIKALSTTISENLVLPGTGDILTSVQCGGIYVQE